MSRFLHIMFCLTLCSFVISCSQGTNGDPVGESDVLSAPSANSSMIDNHEASDWDPDDYDVVILDDDHWQIRLWEIRNRRGRGIGYQGHLWYESGDNAYEGHASAVYNYEEDIFAVQALDSSWSGGHIMYNLKFTEEDGSELSGC